jgi:hypothetical protein
MGMGNMLKGTKFCFVLEKLDEYKTKVINESYYQPVNVLLVSVMNRLIMKRKMRQIQKQIQTNIKFLTEK